MHAYEIRPRKDKRGVDLISDALPFGRLWSGKPDAALGIVDHLRRGLAHCELITHFSDLGGLLLELGCESLCLFSELGCESLYLFLLLSDRRFQLLNFANFAIEHGWALGWRPGRATTLRCAGLHRWAPTLA